MIQEKPDRKGSQYTLHFYPALLFKHAFIFHHGFLSGNEHPRRRAYGT